MHRRSVNCHRIACRLRNDHNHINQHEHNFHFYDHGIYYDRNHFDHDGDDQYDDRIDYNGNYDIHDHSEYNHSLDDNRQHYHNGIDNNSLQSSRLRVDVVRWCLVRKLQ